jgi:hypothetical protein
MARMAELPQKLTLEVDRRAESIAGRLCDDRGTTFPFTGWLGFASALQQALDHPDGAPPKT